jgi:hypothetical protein
MTGRVRWALSSRTAQLGNAAASAYIEAMRTLLVGLLAWALLSAPAVAAPGVQLTIKEGRVWLAADRASVAQILSEWARVGRTQVVNAELVTGAPLTLQLSGVPEQQALDVVLRSAGGFMTVGRSTTPDPASTASKFERILILPATRAAGPLMPAPAPAPVFLQPTTMAPVFTGGTAQPVIGPDGLPVPDDQEGAPPPRPAVGSMPPGFSPPSPTPPGLPTATPSVPAGVLTPGMTAPAPRR